MRIEIYLPDKYERVSFEKDIDVVLEKYPGAKIMPEGDDEDYKLRLEEYLSGYKRRLEKLAEQSRNPNIIKGRIKGYARFAAAIVERPNTTQVICDTLTKDEEKFTGLRSRIMKIFLECTEKEPADTSSKQPEFTYWGENILKPMQANILIARFGLADGQQMDYQEVAQNLSMQSDAVANMGKKAIDMLRVRTMRRGRNEELGQFITEIVLNP